MTNVNRKIIVAISLVILMAVSTCAGVAFVVPKAVAAEPAPYIIPIDGQQHVFSGGQMNYHSNCGFVDGVASSGSTIQLAYTANPQNDWRWGDIGIQWTPDSRYTQSQLQQTQATVRVTGSWNATLGPASGDSFKAVNIFAGLDQR